MPYRLIPLAGLQYKGLQFNRLSGSKRADSVVNKRHFRATLWLLSSVAGGSQQTDHKRCFCRFCHFLPKGEGRFASESGQQQIDKGDFICLFFMTIGIQILRRAAPDRGLILITLASWLQLGWPAAIWASSWAITKAKRILPSLSLRACVKNHLCHQRYRPRMRGHLSIPA